MLDKHGIIFTSVIPFLLSNTILAHGTKDLHAYAVVPVERRPVYQLQMLLSKNLLRRKILLR